MKSRASENIVPFLRALVEWSGQQRFSIKSQMVKILDFVATCCLYCISLECFVLFCLQPCKNVKKNHSQLKSHIKTGHKSHLAHSSQFANACTRERTSGNHDDQRSTNTETGDEHYLFLLVELTSNDIHKGESVVQYLKAVSLPMQIYHNYSNMEGEVGRTCEKWSKLADCLTVNWELKILLQISCWERSGRKKR